MPEGKEHLLESLKTLIETMSSVLESFGVLLLTYVIIMGLSQRAGKLTWLAKEKSRRQGQGEPCIELASRNPRDEVPWKDSSVLKGGFQALVVVLILSSYVVIMLAVSGLAGGELGNQATLVRLIGLLLLYPILMLGFIIIIFIVIHRSKNTVKSNKMVILIALSVSGLCMSTIYSMDNPSGVFGEVLVRNPSWALMVQILLLFMMSVSYSYVMGMASGIKEATVEGRFPLVEVTLCDGSILEKQWFYEKTDNDYRFIGQDKVERIIPGTRISEIRPL